jgi:hypothetical protein
MNDEILVKAFNSAFIIHHSSFIVSAVAFSMANKDKYLPQNRQARCLPDWKQLI